ncbi:MAG: YihY/virulence factor BrkB family protein [Planctomycetaceae bacterium]
MRNRTLTRLIRWLKRIVTQPRHELNRWQQAVRYSYELGRHGARQLHHDRAPQMAAALSFRALFGLLPTLIVATVAVRSLIGLDKFLGLINDYLAAANLDNIRLLRPADGVTESVTLSNWLGNLVNQAAHVDLAAVGWVGLGLLMYAAIGLMVTIENAFNIIYRSPEGRSWSRRVPLYWFLLTISPLTLGMASYLSASFESTLYSVDTWHWLLATLRLIWGLGLGWVFLVAVYRLVPNTHVDIRSAAIGAAVGIILLELGKRMLSSYFENAFTISQLYGSLGLIPLFMFWVYLMWLAVLFGLEVSATLQMLHGRRLQEVEQSRATHLLVEPAAVVRVMQAVADAFQSGRRITNQQISEQTRLPSTISKQIVDRLISVGFVHPLESDKLSICLAKPPDQISLERLMGIGFQLADQGADSGGAGIFEKLRQVQKHAVANRTLATIQAVSVEP